MNKTLFITVVFVLALFTLGNAFSSEVTNVALNYNDGYTVAQISVNGPIRFTHQTEIAKDGKPFRVIVDILSATHNLGANKFSFLPPCAIKSIRTSQYSVKPERIVRIVFDMKRETIYRVESDNKYITIYFADKNNRKFTTWSTALTVAEMNKKKKEKALSKEKETLASTDKVVSVPKSSQELNESIKKDRLLSLKNVSTQKNNLPVPSKRITQKKNINKTLSDKKVTSKTVFASNEKVPNSSKSITVSSTKNFSTDKITERKNNTKKVLAKKSTPQKTVKKYSVKVSSGKVPYGPFVDNNLLKKVNKPVVSSKVQKKTNTKVATTVKNNANQVLSPSSKGKKTVKKANKTTLASQKPEIKKATTNISKPKVTVSNKPAKKIQYAQVTETISNSKVTPSQQKAISPKNNSPKVKTRQSKAIKKASAPVIKTKVEHKKNIKSQNVDTKKSSPSKSKSTSRFRRNPVVSNKIKGTLVAKFPKRLIIKYKSRAYRDPFETLINESKVYNNPVEKRVPNVEGLKLVGIIESENHDNSALFEDKEGYGYILKSGDKVRKGYVLRVANDRVYFQIFEYGWSRTVSLKLES